jgi:hypothetical protein
MKKTQHNLREENITVSQIKQRNQFYSVFLSIKTANKNKNKNFQTAQVNVTSENLPSI